MKAYNISIIGKQTIIKRKTDDFRMQVYLAEDYILQEGTASLEATLYIEDRAFIPSKSYLFELIDNEEKPLTDYVNIDLFKSAIAFYFNAILDTDLFVISIPIASIYCPEERKNYNYYKVAV